MNSVSQEFESAPNALLMALEFRAPWELWSVLPSWPALARAASACTRVMLASARNLTMTSPGTGGNSGRAAVAEVDKRTVAKADHRARASFIAAV